MKRRILAMTLLGVGASMAFVGLLDLKSTAEFSYRAEQAVARVSFTKVRIDLASQPMRSWYKADKSSESCYETVVFRTGNGVRVMRQRALGSRMQAGGVVAPLDHVPDGYSANVIYDPQTPYRFRFDSFAAVWGTSIAALAGGFVIISLAIATRLGTSLPALMARAFCAAEPREPQGDLL